ncbi:MAG: ATPase [Candidatus Buchananbacteria bacterium CG10_big_fil_rev_8_21_14_0_10_42_9]|uniref:ATPase n=1 Tax=Candidatus Buchananbacteria bacterium CG10_big_fil_rev_8_21_14_0_10_42_9 TaxID=1974526 RepID=A0A2H0W3V2_9BACT|nr:MAG: ATPase [Candidatus Buchananbacteria bacterium CG10_big_fil_rev_8_21_14_0_10_42_9]
MHEVVWHNLSTHQVLAKLETTDQGLSQKQVELRQKKYGKNKLPSAKPLSRFKILISQFTSPLVYVLLFAALVSLYLRELTDFSVIALALIVNTLVGYIQENKANRAITQLRKLIHPEALVIRDNEPVKLDTAELVPGDVVILEAGDRVGADARVIESQNLQLVESMLTGESSPSDKSTKKIDQGVELAERENMVYMGTVVSYGRGKAVITHTGVNTEIGKITKLIKHTKEEKTPLQKNLLRFSRQISLAVLIIALTILVIGLFRGFSVFPNHATGEEGIFNLAVAIAVAAIPEGLLVSVTVVLALGLQAILKKKALVRKMLAVETIGAVSVICTDKTGTLTLGKMKVDQLYTFRNASAPNKFKLADKKEFDEAAHHIIKTGVLCNNAIVTHQDDPLKSPTIVGMPTEVALIDAGLNLDVEKSKLEKEFPRVDEVPFTSEEKFMATLNGNSTQTVYVKGAPEKVLSFCSKALFGNKEVELDRESVKTIKLTYEKATASGLRLLACAYKKNVQGGLSENLSGLVFTGLVALKDPLRPEVKDTIKLTQKAGIKTVIITGDHPLTAKAIVSELGFKVTKDNILVGSELDKLSDREFNQKVKDILIYARTEPRHKIRIVEAWQSLGEVVAMTGDGINDSPAVKKANVGIVVGSGTEVAKESADIILLDNNFKTITDAIWQGRKIFENIKKIILYLLTDSFSEVILVTGALLFGLPLPVTAVQILWINLITDGLPGVSLTFEPGEEGVKEEPPRKPQKGIFDREMKFIIFLVAIIVDIILLTLFFLLIKDAFALNFTIDHIRTIIFASLGIDSLFYVYSIRTMKKPFYKSPLFNNRILNYSVIAGFFLQLLPIYVPFLQKVFSTVPLSWEWLPILALAAIKISLIELVKHIFHKPNLTFAKRLRAA